MRARTAATSAASARAPVTMSPWQDRERSRPITTGEIAAELNALEVGNCFAWWESDALRIVVERTAPDRWRVRKERGESALTGDCDSVAAVLTWASA